MGKTIHISRRIKKEDLAKAVERLSKKMRLDARKFCGLVRWKEDALVAQKRMRNEWVMNYGHT